MENVFGKYFNEPIELENVINADVLIAIREASQIRAKKYMSSLDMDIVIILSRSFANISLEQVGVYLDNDFALLKKEFPLANEILKQEQGVEFFNILKDVIEHKIQIKEIFLKAQGLGVTGIVRVQSLDEMLKEANSDSPVEDEQMDAIIRKWRKFAPAPFPIIDSSVSIAHSNGKADSQRYIDYLDTCAGNNNGVETLKIPSLDEMLAEVVMYKYDEELILLALKENLLLKIGKDFTDEDILKALNFISEHNGIKEEPNIFIDEQIEKFQTHTIDGQCKIFKKEQNKPTFRDLEFNGGKKRWK